MRCPGQDTRYWKPGDIFEVSCPQCAHPVEFFKDEPSRKCKNCGHRFVNPRMDFGCAAYCKFAEQCIGNLDEALLVQRDELFKNRVALEMKRYFNKDFKRIAHTIKVVRYAEKIVKEEKGDLAIVLSAAYLLDIGIKGETDQRDARDEGPSQKENEKGAFVQKILTRLGASNKLIEEVNYIVSNFHHPKPHESINFRSVYDANLIADLEERQQNAPIHHERLAAYIDKELLTISGRRLAKEILLQRE